MRKYLSFTTPSRLERQQPSGDISLNTEMLHCRCHVGLGDLNSGPLACTTSTFSSKPSPWPSPSLPVPAHESLSWSPSWPSLCSLISASAPTAVACCFLHLSPQLSSLFPALPLCGSVPGFFSTPSSPLTLTPPHTHTHAQSFPSPTSFNPGLHLPSVPFRPFSWSYGGC